MKTIVSIIMPVYNGRAYLKEAIDSVLAQTFKQFELILIDDGSTDDSWQVIEQYKLKDQRIKAFHISNRGPSAARNLGLLKAQGEWIQFLDADDFFETKMLETFYENAKDVDMVIGGAVQDYTRLNKSIMLTVPSASLAGEREIAEYLKGMDEKSKSITLNYVWNRWIRKSVLETKKIKFNEALRLGEDFVFNCEVLKNISKVKIIEEALYHHYYRNETTLSHCFVREEPERRKQMHSELCDLMKSYKVYEDVKQFIERNEGKYCWISLTKVCLPDCKISQKEKIQYIRELYTSQNRKYMMDYFSHEKGRLNRIKQGLVKCNSVTMMFLFLYAYGLKMKWIKEER